MGFVMSLVMGFVVCGFRNMGNGRRCGRLSLCGGLSLCRGLSLGGRHRLRVGRMGQYTAGKRHTRYQQRSDRKLSHHDFSLE